MLRQPLLHLHLQLNTLLHLSQPRTPRSPIRTASQESSTVMEHTVSCALIHAEALRHGLAGGTNVQAECEPAYLHQAGAHPTHVATSPVCLIIFPNMTHVSPKHDPCVSHASRLVEQNMTHVSNASQSGHARKGPHGDCQRPPCPSARQALPTSLEDLGTRPHVLVEGLVVVGGRPHELTEAHELPLSAGCATLPCRRGGGTRSSQVQVASGAGRARVTSRRAATVTACQCQRRSCGSGQPPPQA
jgi:hypothetical protein